MLSDVTQYYRTSNSDIQVCMKKEVGYWEAIIAQKFWLVQGVTFIYTFNWVTSCNSILPPMRGISLLSPRGSNSLLSQPIIHTGGTRALLGPCPRPACYFWVFIWPHSLRFLVLHVGLVNSSTVIATIFVDDCPVFYLGKCSPHRCTAKKVILAV